MLALVPGVGDGLRFVVVLAAWMLSGAGYPNQVGEALFWVAGPGCTGGTDFVVGVDSAPSLSVVNAGVFGFHIYL